jgi:hypothetical protein
VSYVAGPKLPRSVLLVDDRSLIYVTILSNLKRPHRTVDFLLRLGGTVCSLVQVALRAFTNHQELQRATGSREFPIPCRTPGTSGNR